MAKPQKPIPQSHRSHRSHKASLENKKNTLKNKKKLKKICNPFPCLPCLLACLLPCLLACLLSGFSIDNWFLKKQIPGKSEKKTREKSVAWPLLVWQLIWCQCFNAFFPLHYPHPKPGRCAPQSSWRAPSQRPSPLGAGRSWMQLIWKYLEHSLTSSFLSQF